MKLNGFLDNFFNAALNPRGNVGDFQHAQRLYVDDAFRLAPKVKFLYFVNFTFNPLVLQQFPKLSNNHTAELNMLVKQVDLPQYTAEVSTKNQYNRKKNVQTRVDYQPIQLRMHDDNLGLTTMLMEAYYRYYFNDSNITTIEDSYHPRGTYQEVTNGLRYGLDNSRRFPFFKDIKLYQFARHEYTEYTLVNPMISQWGHDTMNQSETTGIAENAMTLVYENVLYDRGAVGEDSPATFATTHYDKSPSPLGVGGGGVNSLFGDGGVLGGIGSILGDINSGNFGLGTIIKGVNVFKNAKNLSKDSIKNEGLSLLEGAAINALNNTVNGVPGTKFPKASGAGGALSTTKATQAASQASEETTKAKVDAAKAANNIGGP
jgi:hypothetical protein